MISQFPLPKKFGFGKTNFLPAFPDLIHQENAGTLQGTLGASCMALALCHLLSA
jgi:hypothetical protein